MCKKVAVILRPQNEMSMFRKAVKLLCFVRPNNSSTASKNHSARLAVHCQVRALLLSCINSIPHKSNTDRDMAAHPHENAEIMGQEKSDEIFNQWDKYWKTDYMKVGIVDTMQGTSNDWKTNAKNGCGDSAVSAATKNNSTSNNTQMNRRWIFGMRHGERVDLTYGIWAPFCFDKNGTYTRKDLNMPEKLTERVGGGAAYAVDTPLTRVGELQARLVGEGLRAAGVPLAHVYSSAALRSVATAHHLLLGLQADPSVKIKVEPGLFEFKNWHLSKGMPPFMTPVELAKAGYNVDLQYKPYVELDVTTPETLQEFYNRNELVIQEAVKKTEVEGGNIIFVGHATTLEITVTALKNMGNSKPVEYQVSNDLLRVPYCALGAMRDKPFEVVSPPCPPSINSGSGRYNWKMLLDL